MTGKTESFEAELVTALTKTGIDHYRMKDIIEPALKMKAEVEIKKYEIDKKIESGIYTGRHETLNKWFSFTGDFLKDSKLQKFFIAVLLSITFLITSGRFFKFITEQLYIENKVHPAQLKTGK